MTRVANVRDCPDEWRDDPRYAYVGRPTQFGNPFKMGREEDRDRVIHLYRNWLFRRADVDPIFAADLEGLRDKVLVCYCHPKRCHADVIVEWLEMMRLD